MQGHIVPCVGLHTAAHHTTTSGVSHCERSTIQPMGMYGPDHTEHHTQFRVWSKDTCRDRWVRAWPQGPHTLPQLCFLQYSSPSTRLHNTLMYKVLPIHAHGWHINMQHKHLQSSSIHTTVQPLPAQAVAGQLAHKDNSNNAANYPVNAASASRLCNSTNIKYTVRTPNLRSP